MADDEGYDEPGGDRLLTYLRGIPVESRWLSGDHVNWLTGQRDKPTDGGPEAKSHCSAFVASVAHSLEIYVLRPPHFPQELLSNAQMEWFAGEGGHPGPTAAASGWSAVGSSADDGLRRAVEAASAGQLVVAGFQQAPTIDGGVKHKHPGHLCLVLPQDADRIGADGPQVMSAGTENWREVLMKTAFEHHHGAWPDGISFFACDTPLQSDAQPGD